MNIKIPRGFRLSQAVNMETGNATLSGKILFPIEGDCLEALGVVDGGYVGIDFTRFPRPPRCKSEGGDGSMDICACWAVYPGKKRPSFMVKAYLGIWGTWQMVGTRYDLKKGEHPFDIGMEAQKILGVVYASWDKDWNLLWKREPRSFPATVWSKRTIHGENIGDPMDTIQVPEVQGIKVTI